MKRYLVVYRSFLGAGLSWPYLEVRLNGEEYLVKKMSEGNMFIIRPGSPRVGPIARLAQHVTRGIPGADSTFGLSVDESLIDRVAVTGLGQRLERKVLFTGYQS